MAIITSGISRESNLFQASPSMGLRINSSQENYYATCIINFQERLRLFSGKDIRVFSFRFFITQLANKESNAVFKHLY